MISLTDFSSYPFSSSYCKGIFSDLKNLEKKESSMRAKIFYRLIRWDLKTHFPDPNEKDRWLTRTHQLSKEIFSKEDLLANDLFPKMFEPLKSEYEKKLHTTDPIDLNTILSPDISLLKSSSGATKLAVDVCKDLCNLYIQQMIKKHRKKRPKLTKVHAFFFMMKPAPVSTFYLSKLLKIVQKNLPPKSVFKTNKV